LVSSSGISDHLVAAMIDGPGVVTGRYGTIGQVFYLDEPFWPLNTTLYVSDFKGNDPRFASYLLRTLDFLAFSDKAAVPGVNRNHVHEAIIRWPVSLDEQKRIAGILGALDDKIELNRRMSQTLESMARATFKSWFVDFDPVRAKAEGAEPRLPGSVASLFPGSFEDSELGKIPAGWKVEPLAALGQIAVGGVWGEDASFSGAVPAVCLRGVDLEHLRLDGSRQMDERDVLIAASGAGPTGRPLWISPVLAAALGTSTYSNFCKRIRCNSASEAIYLDSCLQGMRESNEIWEYVNGTSIPNLDATSLLAKKLVVVPSLAVLERYASFVGSIWDAKYGRRDTELAEVRGRLLPALVGGLRTPRASALIEAAR
jgi:type I restriction enzyme S subunit